MSSNLPAIQNDAALMPSPSEWTLMRDMAAALLPTGFLPEALKQPEQVVAVMLKGRELRVPPMYALSNIVIVKGKPTASAELMLALIQRDFGQRAIRVKESDDTHCTVEYRQEGWAGTQSYTFTIDQAVKAGLAGSQTWKSYPAAMLRARCISAVARMAFPGSIGGMYVPGELGDAVDVTDDGEVISTTTVDVETGELLDAPVSARNAPRAIEAPAEPSEDPQRALAALHAAAAQYDIDHDAIHALFATQGYASTKDVPVEALKNVTQYLNRGNPRAVSDRQKVQERFRVAVMAYAGQAGRTPAPADDAGLDEEDYAQVMAAIEADAAPANADRWTR